MNGESNPSGDLIHIRVMNEYGGGLPLWPDDVDDLDLSDGLRADLMAFADRWDAAIDPEVTDDRWDGVPVMQTLVGAKYSLGRLLHPARERSAEAEHEDMRRTGEALAVRVQDELGPAYRVTYVH
ncbi:hypothetical protein AERO_00075 [Aeromicrobium fastidiosum]|uniref:hypothetical protein n=1 Tax=Aeromicrobium fastidiosum TaxID=52699 RepID=UPI00202384B4|nr:hypothetical protein [Aeromicrobium fastidiosum]MCL8249766.1 hypothetical protein [Aeromicrobium fastidiosum]